MQGIWCFIRMITCHHSVCVVKKGWLRYATSHKMTPSAHISDAAVGRSGYGASVTKQVTAFVNNTHLWCSCRYLARQTTYSMT